MASGKQWHNWAHNQTCNAKIFQPKNKDELIDIVLRTQKEKKTLHAYGTAHSWSDIALTNGYLINTDKLKKIVWVDPTTNQVTVQAGIKLHDLNNKLEDLGLSLPNQGAIMRQSLAGVVSTATHGSGKTGTFASFITKVQLLCADGTLRTISPAYNADLWPAVRTSMGTLGIMTELTIQCEPLFYLNKNIRRRLANSNA